MGGHFLVIKSLHVICAVVSVTGFIVRGAMMLAQSQLLQHKIARVAPHVVDTILLATAIWLCVATHQYPFKTDWLTAKLLALLAYIGFGVAALRFRRVPALFAALISVTYLVLVALTRNPLVFW